MMQNAYFLAKMGADTAENEQHFAQILPIGLRPRGRGREHLRGTSTYVGVQPQAPRYMRTSPQERTIGWFSRLRSAVAKAN